MEQRKRLEQIATAANATTRSTITIYMVEAVVRAAARNRDVRLALENAVQWEYERIDESPREGGAR